MAFIRFVVLLFFLCATAVHAGSLPSIPDTPAGRALGTWLNAFNAGDRTQMGDFIKTYRSPRDIDQEMATRKFSGGFDLANIVKSGPLRIVFRVKEKDSASAAVGKLVLGGEHPPVISVLSLYEAPPGSKYTETQLDAAERKRVIDASSRLLREFYVDPEVAKTLGAILQGHLKHGDYDAIMDGELLSQTVTADLLAASHDKHLSVDYYMFAQSEERAGNKAEEDARYRKEMAQENCGFDKVEHLPGNIGYLKFDSFGSPNICAPTAIAAMNFLADCNALVVDLRENGGGAPSMVAFMSSYLFDKPTHLNDIYDRPKNTTDQFWTLPYVPGRKFVDKPVYLLVSKNTFSAAEEFGYTLKHLGRATLVGERTAGGAHPTGDHRIDAHFSIAIPFARSINPVTKTDWEGVGLEPDVKVPAADALDAALRLAREKLQRAH